jgi:hypothetical protein
MTWPERLSTVLGNRRRLDGHLPTQTFRTMAFPQICASVTLAADPPRLVEARAPTAPRTAKVRFRWTVPAGSRGTARIRTVLLAARRDHGSRRIPGVAARALRAAVSRQSGAQAAQR